MKCPKCASTDYSGPDEFGYYSCEKCYYEWEKGNRKMKPFTQIVVSSLVITIIVVIIGLMWLWR